MSFHRDRRVCDRCGRTAQSGSNVHAPGWFYAHADRTAGVTFHLCSDCCLDVPKIVADVRSVSALWGFLVVGGGS
jgi:hypothetical protein